jgi:F-type H+-transporting ATPase subunit b
MMTAVICTLLMPHIAMADSGPSSGRKIWDNVMLWVNFGILVFLFLKFARKPLMDFLHSTRKKISEDLDKVKEALSGAKTIRDEEIEKTKDLESLLEDLRKSILDMGAREKEEIIRQGQAAAEKMIQEAKEYAARSVSLAKKKLSDDMVDRAITIAEKGLKEALSKEDHDMLIDQFVEDLSSSKHQRG